MVVYKPLYPVEGLGRGVNLSLPLFPLGQSKLIYLQSIQYQSIDFVPIDSAAIAIIANRLRQSLCQSTAQQLPSFHLSIKTAGNQDTSQIIMQIKNYVICLVFLI